MGAHFPTLAAALAASTVGDRIDVLPGTYRGDVGVVRHPLSIRGLGDGAVFDAAGQHVLGKGTLVVQADAHIENLEFRGARVPDGNGAGIRLDSGRLKLLRCRLRDNEMGLLASNDPGAELDIEDCVFADAPRHAGLLHHLLYAGTIARLTLTGNRFENGWRGHLVKSRARINTIVCNLLRDGPEGGASYELELANGGHSLISGNVIVQGPKTQNPAVVAVGYSADPSQPHSLVLVHNTLVNAGPADGRFLRLWMENMHSLSPLLLANNLWVGNGNATLPPRADGGGNVQVPAGALGDAGGGDYRLRAACPANLRAVELPRHVQPRRALTLPLGTVEATIAQKVCVGAAIGSR